MKMKKDFTQNINYVNENIEYLLKEHRDKYLLIFDSRFISAYDEYSTAASEGIRMFGMDGNFLVRYIPEDFL